MTSPSPSPNGSVEPLKISLAVFESVAQMVIVILSGVVLSRRGMMSRKDAVYLAKLSVNLLLPCLTLVKIAEVFTFGKLATWWLIIVFAFVHAILGALMGHAVRLISAEKPDLVRSVVVTCVCGNSGVIPLAIMAGMCASSGPLGSEAECENKDAYIFIYTTISNLIMWSWGFVEMGKKRGYHMPPSSSEVTPGEVLPRTMVSTSVGADIELEVRPSVVVSKDTATASSTRRRVRSSSSSSWSSYGMLLRALLTPPAAAAFAGILIGGITFLRNILIGENAPLRSVARACSDLGAGAIPLLMLVLGQSLSQGPSTTGRSSNAVIRRSTIALVSASRLLIMPALGMILVMLLDIAGALPDDRVLKFVLLLEGGVPTALSLVSISQLVGQSESGTRGISTLLFWQYGASIISSTLMCCVFLAWVLSG